ncbi:MAG: hypothetical protein ACYC8T_15265 [Myxococcaceae bacterium]
MHRHLVPSARLFVPGVLIRALLAGSLALVGCGEPPPPPDAGTPRYCVGGVVTPDGGCVAKCDPAKCLPNNTCVNNACVLKCTSHLQCATATQRCAPGVEDDTAAPIFICTNTDMRQIGVACSAGECPVGLTCRSTGPGDPTEYCTRDCGSDGDCPGGYECGYQRDPHEVCGSNPKKGNNSFCGKTTEPCITPGAPDASIVEGDICLQRRICLKRDDCAPCANDIDCSLSGDKCVTIGGQKRCARACRVDTDCDGDKKCDEGFCKPYYGACEGSVFCAPCRFDRDCEPNFQCMRLHGNERSCVDARWAQSCVTNADCPVAPSGLHGTCFNAANGTDPTDWNWQLCYAPYTTLESGSETYSCYDLKRLKPWPDGGTVDAGRPDAGPPDAGPPDAGPPDAGPPDAGPYDAGPEDAGPVDAGEAPDSGTEADAGDGG